MTLVTDINVDPIYGWTMDPYMNLGSSVGLDHILALGGGNGPSGGTGSGIHVVTWQQLGLDITTIPSDTMALRH